LLLAVDTILLSFAVKLNGEPCSYTGFKGNNRSYLSVLNTRTRALNYKTFFNIKAFSVLGTKGVDPSLSNIIGL
jgi:hypothetical protein